MLEPLWLWGILGLVLLAIEMFLGTFYLLWFGVSAFCMSVALLISPALSLAMQLFLYSALSLGSLTLWKMYDQKTSQDFRVGQSQSDEIGRVGTITEVVSPKQNGRIRFAQGVMGSKEWEAIANENIEIGVDAIITKIEGNALWVRRA